MTLHPARPGDRPGIEAFLRGHEASSVFPLSNLVGALPQKLWVARDADGISGVLALNPGGVLMPQWPDPEAGAARRVLAGQSITALVGPLDQVTALRAALGIGADRLRHDGREPLCRLDLKDLVLPDCTGLRLLPLEAMDREPVADWRAAYNAETFGAPAAGGKARAREDVDRWLAAGSHRVLWDGDARVALTGLNARLPDVVQVGGVFVPPALRNRGYARRAVALHLAEARAGGAERAVLFAASAAALAAYQAIGFVQCGWMGIALLHKPVVPA